MFSIKHHIDKEQYAQPIYKRSWSYNDLVSIFPHSSIRILDVGAGRNVFPARQQDEVISIDFDEDTRQTIKCDFTKEWPFNQFEFDLIYASHVIEHLYPQDRDQLLSNMYKSLKANGILFIRVPHRSSIQATGLEHHTFYGTNGFTSLCHGSNPYLPLMDMISAGIWMNDVSSFYSARSGRQKIFETILNASFRLTDQYLCYLFGGLPEVQFMLLKPSDEPSI